MRRNIANIIPGLFAFLISVQVSHARIAEVRNAGLARSPTERMRSVIFYSPSGDEALLVRFKRELLSRGAFHVNVFLPSYVACELPDSLDGEALAGTSGLELASADNTYSINAKDLGNRIFNSSMDENWIKECYLVARAISGEEGGLYSASGVITKSEENLDTLLLVPKEIIREYQSRVEGGTLQDERNPSQNSEFLLGDVLVQLVLPESEGSAENWSDKQISEVAMGAYAAMLSYQEKYSYAQMNFTFREFNRAKTLLEPIDYNSDSDYLWINDVMGNLGYDNAKEGIFGLVHDFNNDGRKYYGTDWVFTAFVANSQHAYKHRFKNAGYTAYAYLGGPFLVIPYPAGENPYEIDQVLLFSLVFQHEASHIFWALDEYLSAMSDCHSHCGYLDYYNMNKIMKMGSNNQPLGCQKIVPCIMARAKEDLGRPICYHTAGMVGVVDSDEDGVPDVFQSTPEAHFTNASVETVTTSEVIVKCKAVSPPVPNRNPVQDPSTRIDYAAPLRNGMLKVNDAGNIFIVPDDGTWDEMEEDITIKMPSLETGLTKLGIRLSNAAGVFSQWYVKKIYNVGLTYSHFNREITNEGIGLNWSLIGVTFGARFDMYRIEGKYSKGDTLIFQDLQPVDDPFGEFTYYALFDSTVEAGKTYYYFVRGTFELGKSNNKRTFISDSDMIRVTASMPIRGERIVSSTVPNPFVSYTTFSIKVPASYRDIGPSTAFSYSVSAKNVSPGLIKEEVPTRVEASIYDVTGKLVKRLFNNSVFSTVLTLQWNGTNRSNELVSSGIYFLKVATGGFTEVRKIVLIR